VFVDHQLAFCGDFLQGTHLEITEIIRREIIENGSVEYKKAAINKTPSFLASK
jgi:hypothetical protein